MNAKGIIGKSCKQNASASIELDKKVPKNQGNGGREKTRLNELIKADFVFIK